MSSRRVLRKLSRLAPFATLLVAVACSTSSSSGTPTSTAISPPANCNEDDMLACSQGSTGFACQSGTNPEAEDDTLACSTPVTAGNTDEFCCFTVPGADDGDDSSCQPDDTIACQTNTVGYSCSTGDDPTSLDSTLTCSASSTSDDGDGGLGVSDYCCAKSGTVTGDDDDDDPDASPPAGCTTAGACTGDSVGYSCGPGVNPEKVDPSLACSAPIAGANGKEMYCCFTGFRDPSAGTCQPDDDVSLACASGTFGFSCAVGDSDPTTQDDSLSACSASTTMGDQDDYCCAYE